jgi:hypothetical protein
MSNEHPFQIGQKVVRTGPGSGKMVKGLVYTVGGLKKCSCGMWRIAVPEIKEDYSDFECSTCYEPIEQYGWDADLFAPIQPAYENISEQLAKKATETPEISDLPVKQVEVTN